MIICIPEEGRAEAAEGYSFSYIKVRVECEEGLEWSGGAK